MISDGIAAIRYGLFTHLARRTFTFRPWKSGGTNAQLDILAAADESTSHPSFDVIHKLAELRHSEASSASRTYDVWQDAGPSSPSPGQSLEIEGCADANVPGQECSPGSMCQAGGEAKVSEARRISCASARPSGGSVIAPLAAERNTICPMPLQYCLDQEVQATFDLQRFDEEIQRLSDFSSPMEGWLHDLEQKIADEMGKVSTLNKLVQDSFYKAAAVSLEHSQRRVSPGEPGSCDYSSRRVFLSFPSSNTFDLDPCNSRTSFTQNNGSLCNHRPGH